MSEGLDEYIGVYIESGLIDPTQPYKCKTWADGKTYDVTITFKKVDE